jgi:hypothetical protein
MCTRAREKSLKNFRRSALTAGLDGKDVRSASTARLAFYSSRLHLDIGLDGCRALAGAGFAPAFPHSTDVKTVSQIPTLVIETGEVSPLRTSL